jgi:hypothetical protein
MRHAIRSLTPLLALGLLIGCTSEDAPPPGLETQPVSMTAPSILTVVAHDFYFEAPDSIPAGFTTVRLVNQGGQTHSIQLWKLAPGKTLGDVLDSARAGERHPSWAIDAGGPNVVAYGQTSSVGELLEPGDYVITCLVIGRDGQTHILKGMARALRVTRSGAHFAAPPKTDLTITLLDYGFEVPPMIAAGRHTIRIVNDAHQPHEVLLLRLDPGKTYNDYLIWAESQDGAAPGVFMGGVTSIEGQHAAIVEADLTPGDYALLCELPDAKDGRPHFLHGMIRQIKVT